MATWEEARPWVFSGGILTLLLVFSVAQKLKRGLRLNNPGNLERSGSWMTWDGLAPDQPDPRFVKYVAPEYGIEALGQVLLNKQIRKGLVTTAAIVEDYAPKSDGNNTTSYAANVAKALKVGTGQVIDMIGNKAQHIAFVKAVMVEENSVKYPEPMVEAAVNRARRDVLGVA